MQSAVRYGILSAASIVPRFVKGMRLCDNGEVTAIWSRSEEKARAMAEELDIEHVYADHRELLNDPDIDAVYIPLINSLHYSYVKEALLAGKHVLCEKPFVLHAEEARELSALAHEKGLFLTEAVKTPFLPIYDRIREILNSGILGAMRYMEFRQSYTDGPYVGGWNTQIDQGGGVLYGNEAYFFAMAEYLAGKIRSVTGTLSFPDGEAEDQLAVSALLPNGVLATLQVSRRVLFENGLTIRCDHGKIVIPDYWKASRAYVYEGDRLKETIDIPCPYEFQYELRHYSQCIQDGLVESPVTTHEDTIRRIAFTEQLYAPYR